MKPLNDFTKLPDPVVRRVALQAELMRSVEVIDLDAQALTGDVVTDILVKFDEQEVAIANGNRRATAMADLGRLVPARDASGQHFLLKRDDAGRWAIATRQEIEREEAQNCMRAGRKVNASPVTQTKKPVPYWRQFDKRKF